MDTQKLLEERNTTHGAFTCNAEIAQRLKDIIHVTDNYNFHMTDVHKEALDMICHKIARLCCGDCKFDDTWDDISGYAQLPLKFNHGFMSLDEAEKRVVQ